MHASVQFILRPASTMPDGSSDRSALPSADWQTVQWHADAPAQPAWGTPCNGCGLCCLAEPCPLGMLVSRRRHGACMALRWDESAVQYRCGLLTDPAGVTGWRRPWALRWLRGLARRWISAGTGCDAHPLQVERVNVASPTR
ncbi:MULTISPECIES: hypothetical protein [unclassified Acidovorax]|uniref:hypothetical protein n=1 Tax=unclassified Acidovorax TaxID=2684926 RepID=UPI002882E761|nr:MULTISPECIES: hypothetical protein [unclassified Acidovorax]